MARLVGVDLPRNKRLEVALTYIYGIGPARAAKILEKTGISPDLRTDDLTEDQYLALKMNSVINQIQNELCRMKKIPANASYEVVEGQEMLLSEVDKNLYQLHNIRGVDYDTMNDSLIFNENGTARIFYC